MGDLLGTDRIYSIHDVRSIRGTSTHSQNASQLGISGNKQHEVIRARMKRVLLTASTYYPGVPLKNDGAAISISEEYRSSCRSNKAWAIFTSFSHFSRLPSCDLQPDFHLQVSGLKVPHVSVDISLHLPSSKFVSLEVTTVPDPQQFPLSESQSRRGKIF